MPRQILIQQKKDTLSLLSQKWTVDLLRALARLHRFSYVRRELGITSKTLSKRLQLLIDEGLVVRAAYAEAPIRIEYELTAKGRELIDILSILDSWEKKWS